jgi:hypothetical protein
MAMGMGQKLPYLGGTVPISTVCVGVLVLGFRFR